MPRRRNTEVPMNHEQLFLLTQTKDLEEEDTAEPAPGSTDPGLCTYPTHAGAAYQGTKRIPGMGARAGGRCDQPCPRRDHQIGQPALPSGDPCMVS